MAEDKAKKRTQFQLEMEQAITIANREVMKAAKLPAVNQDAVLPLAITVARLRAKYLKTSLALGASGHSDLPVESELDELAKDRRAYEEGVAAFEALMRAIERGYIDLEGE
jgi:hypothetical protein